MKSKLTLWLDASLIKRVKKQAKQKGTSVSQMVENYFALLDYESKLEYDKLPPITASLVGILEDLDLSEGDYKAFLKEKYLEEYSGRHE